MSEQKETLLKWDYILPNYQIQKSVYDKFTYTIEYSNKKYTLYITIGETKDHINGNLTIGKLKRLAEKDLKRRLEEHNFTGYYDDANKPIFVGDKLKSKWGYEVIVMKDEDGDYSGKLVCDDNHSCKNIPYALNFGKDYKKYKNLLL